MDSEYVRNSICVLFYEVHREFSSTFIHSINICGASFMSQALTKSSRISALMELILLEGRGTFNKQGKYSMKSGSTKKNRQERKTGVCMG